MPLFKDEAGDATLRLEGFDAADIGAEPIGAEARAKAYTDQKINTLPPPPTLTSLGGIPLSQKGAAGGIPSLGSDGKIPINQLPQEALIFPANHTHFWGYGKIITAGKAFTTVLNTGYEWGRIAVLSPPALGDIVEFKCALDKGNYLWSLIADKYSDRGIITFSINGIDVGSVDCYASGAYQPRALFQFQFTIPSAGIQTIRGTTSSKNAASSGYNIAISAILINPV